MYIVMVERNNMALVERMILVCWILAERCWTTSSVPDCGGRYHDFFGGLPLWQILDGPVQVSCVSGAISRYIWECGVRLMFGPICVVSVSVCMYVVDGCGSEWSWLVLIWWFVGCFRFWPNNKSRMYLLENIGILSSHFGGIAMHSDRAFEVEIRVVFPQTSVAYDTTSSRALSI